MDRSRTFLWAMSACFTWAAMAARVPASPIEDSQQLFIHFDRNGDGQLSAGEIGAYNFLRYDTDGDGVVSQAEFLAGRAADKRNAAAAGNTEAAFKLLD